MWIQATADITLTLNTEIMVDDNATKEEIEAAVNKAIANEANELLGGVDFLDEDIKNLEWNEI